IARPGGGSDVPFRSVAARLLQRLKNQASIEIEVLRPSTLNALALRLQAASMSGSPYSILHFDGHGIYADLMAKFGIEGEKRGYLVFEDADNRATHHPVDGGELGELLVQNGVSVVILNACRSARAEAVP